MALLQAPEVLTFGLCLNLSVAMDGIYLRSPSIIS